MTVELVIDDRGTCDFNMTLRDVSQGFLQHRIAGFEVGPSPPGVHDTKYGIGAMLSGEGLLVQPRIRRSDAAGILAPRRERTEHPRKCQAGPRVCRRQGKTHFFPLSLEESEI